MISALILVLTWIILASVMSNRNTLPKGLVPILSFICSEACLIIIFFLLIHFGSNSLPKYIITAYLLLALVLLTRPKVFSRGIREIKRLLLPDEQEECTSQSSKSMITLLRFIINLRLGLTVFCLSLIVLFAALNASPSSWDSYTYNLSRVVLMIIRGSPLLNSASIPQATFPLGHDLLYYPDLIFGNLRGLGLINSLEFILMTGTILGLCDLIQSKILSKRPLHLFQLEYAKLIAVCLLFSSDQQILQSLSVKNDLVITLFFSVAVLLALYHLRNPESFTLPAFLVSSLFLSVIGYAAKSYGVICIFPTVIALLMNYRKIIKSKVGIIDQLKSVRFTFGRPILLFIGSLTVGLGIILKTFQGFVYANYLGTPQYESSVGRFINRFPSATDYLQVGLLNSARFILNFFSYPYSTLLKPNPKSPDDYLLGLSPIVNLLSQNGLGVAQGYAYSLSRYRSEDVSLTGPLTHIAFLLAAITLIYCGSTFAWRKYISTLRNYLSIQSTFVIIFSSFSAGLTIFTILAYHNWTFKYVGSVYICLLPLLAFLLSINIFEISRIDHGGNQFSRSTVQLLRLGSLGLVVSCLALFVSLLLINSRLLSPPWSNDTRFQYQIYREYLSASGYKTEKSRIDFLHLFNAEGGRIKFALCYGEETPTLPQFLELMKSKVQSESLTLITDKNACTSTHSSENNQSLERTVSLP